MRLSHEQLEKIFQDMRPVAWKELGRLYNRRPLGVAIDGNARNELVHLELAKPVGRQNLEYGITELGEVVWEQHGAAAFHRRRS